MSRVAVVTGSSGAIGAATCEHLATAGYAVAGLDVRPPAAGAGHRHLTVDLGDPQAVVTAFDEVAAELGGPVLLVNNAGVYLARDFLDTTVEELDQVLTVNVKSAFWCAQAFARQVVAAGGDRPSAIVNVASVSGQTGSPDAAYGASKGAVIALTRSLAGVLAPYRIRVNAVAPGIVHSAMADRIPSDRQAHYLDGIPLGRFARPGEIAAVITILASATASYMTGAVVDVNGGLH
ncbi:SDR family oxidoreductase [Micromonospora sp. NPDC005189]|uniref:SDR family NAD(P)-dependent oxidoreductase n=1 Tax=unclassified Micromonospora TaxID=2617518 RepID=UPI0033A0E6E2